MAFLTRAISSCPPLALRYLLSMPRIAVSSATEEG